MKGSFQKYYLKKNPTGITELVSNEENLNSKIHEGIAEGMSTAFVPVPVDRISEWNSS